VGTADNLRTDDSDWDDGNFAWALCAGAAQHLSCTDIERTGVKSINSLDGAVYLRSMAALQWFYATLVDFLQAAKRPPC
jgi:hypothetical protein